jgi:hypothetical protein
MTGATVARVKTAMTQVTAGTAGCTLENGS